MKNFDMQCSVNGTSALQPEFEQAPSNAVTIIEFPSHASFSMHAPSQRPSSSMHAGAAAAKKGIRHVCRLDAEVAHSLRYGSIEGISYGRVKPWQAALAGCSFTILAFASLFLGL